MVVVGNQLWPERDQLLPVFMDLSIGVALPQSGMTGMPDIAPLVRVYFGLGW
jgi:hypothetical protein